MNERESEEKKWEGPSSQEASWFNSFRTKTAKEFSRAGRAALVFATWTPNPYEMPVSPYLSAPREPHEGSLAISWDRTQHGID